MAVQGITSESWAQFLRVSQQARMRNPDLSAGSAVKPRSPIAPPARGPVVCATAATYASVPVQPGLVRQRILGGNFDAYA